MSSSARRASQRWSTTKDNSFKREACGKKPISKRMDIVTSSNGSTMLSFVILGKQPLDQASESDWMMPKVFVLPLVETVMVRTPSHLMEASKGDITRMWVSLDASAGLSLSNRMSSTTSGSDASSSSMFMKRLKILT
eukprot:2786075-Pleurochrysis_carterae.AAC.1